MAKITKELINEFIEKHCKQCDTYYVCEGENAVCNDFDKFLKEKEE